jgi:hypothetical protein
VFEHITILLSFVYALALTHLLSTATELAIARNRVRFSGLYTFWVVNAAFTLLVNWLALWGLVALKHWTAAEVVIQFLSAVIQYFTCSTFRVNETGEDETLDLPEIFEQRRPLIFGAFIALTVIASFQNWWDRNNTLGLGPNDWIDEDLTIMPMFVAVIVAGWVRARWPQWLAAVAVFGFNIVFLLEYSLPGG